MQKSGTDVHCLIYSDPIPMKEMNARYMTGVASQLAFQVYPKSNHPHIGLQASIAPDTPASLSVMPSKHERFICPLLAAKLSPGGFDWHALWTLRRDESSEIWFSLCISGASQESERPFLCVHWQCFRQAALYLLALQLLLWLATCAR